MTFIRLQYAAFAAALAVQTGVLPSLAAEGEGGDLSAAKPADTVASMPFSGFFGTGSLFDVQRSLNDPFGSLLSFFGPMQSFMPGVGDSLSLSLLGDGEQEKKCYIEVKMGPGVQADDVKIGLATSGGSVTVAYSAQSMKEDNDPQKGSSRSASSFQVTSSVGLPERCLATPAVLLSSSGGYLLGSEEEGGGRRARIVFPSGPLLSEYIEGKKLPVNVLQLLETGDKQGLDELPPLQRCMAAGFTEGDCEKLGRKKPDVVSVAPFDGPGNVVPIPLYDAPLELLK
ncbi:hypothetical protein ACSSS7_001552 [Eimeria intestinalis]